MFLLHKIQKVRRVPSFSHQRFSDDRVGELYLSTAHGHYFCLSVCLIILNTVAQTFSIAISHGTPGTAIIKIHSNREAYWFSVCSVAETFLGRFSWNFTSLTYQFISHLNPDIFGKWQDISLNFLICSEIIYVCSGSSNSTVTPLLRLGTFSWIVTQIVVIFL